MISEELIQAWHRLREESEIQAVGNHRIRLVTAINGIRVFAALSGASGALGLLVDIPEMLRPVRLDTQRFRRILVEVGSMDGLPSGHIAIALRLVDPDFGDLFHQLVTDVVGEILACDKRGDVIAAIVRILSRWQMFLEGHVGPMSEQEVRGLVGELVVLERLSRRIGVARALVAWRAPHGSIRDFESGAESIEVKTYAPSSGAVVQISDPLQLLPDPGVPLLLACQALSRTDGQGFALPELVRQVRKSFDSDHVLGDDLTNALAARGYLDSHSDRYLTRYTLGEMMVFQVRDGFPRIDPAQITPGITALQFAVSVAALSRFAVNVDQRIGPNESEKAR
jgi:hypothetical protein